MASRAWNVTQEIEMSTQQRIERMCTRDLWHTSLLDLLERNQKTFFRFSLSFLLTSWNFCVQITPLRSPFVGICSEIRWENNRMLGNELKKIYFRRGAPRTSSNIIPWRSQSNPFLLRIFQFLQVIILCVSCRIYACCVAGSLPVYDSFECIIGSTEISELNHLRRFYRTLHKKHRLFSRWMKTKDAWNCLHHHQNSRQRTLHSIRR